MDNAITLFQFIFMIFTEKYRIEKNIILTVNYTYIVSLTEQITSVHYRFIIVM